MDETTEVDVFEENGVLMLRYPDGGVESYDDYLRRTEPGMSYDNATGELIVATPPSAEAAMMPGGEPAPDTFGDTTARMASPYFETAAELAATAGRRPTYFENPLMQGLERTGQYIGDMTLAGLNAGLGTVYGGAGLLGETFGGDAQDERRLARDLAAMFDVAGPAPEGRAVGLLTDAAMAGRAAPSRAEFLAGESGAVPVPFASRPDPAVARAEEVLGLLRSGREDEITDQMLDMGDPVLNARMNEHLFNNYDLPMDAASRAERSGRYRKQGLYHGTGEDFPAFNDAAVYATSNPDLAYTYAPSDGGTILPLVMRARKGAPVIEAGGANWNRLTPSMRAGGPQAPYISGLFSPEEVAQYGEDVLRTRHFEEAAKEQGFSGLTFNDIVDVGGYMSKYFPAGPQREEQLASIKRAGQPSRVETRFYPNQVRSRFARFDPRLAHLRNLNASLAAAGVPLGLLATQPEEEQY